MFENFKRKKNPREKEKGTLLASRVAKDQKQELAWMRSNTKKISKKYTAISNDIEKQLKIIDDYNVLESKSLDFYKSYLKGKERIGKTDDIETKTQSEDSSNSNKSVPADTKKKLDRIEDSVVRKLVESDLQFVLANLPTEVMDIVKLKENLSLWNEHIERVEAQQIAYLGMTNLVDLDLSVIASVNHESQNTKVSSMRRILKKMADKSTLLDAKLENLLPSARQDHNLAFKKLIENLTSHYKKPENRERALKSKMVALQTQKKRKTLKRNGRFLAISKIPTAVLFAIGVVGLASGFPPLQIAAGILLGVTLAVKLPSILIQFRIGKKTLPEVDYSAELSGKYNKKEIESLESKLNISLGDIRGTGAEINFFEHACTDPDCDLEKIEAYSQEKGKNKKSNNNPTTETTFPVIDPVVTPLKEQDPVSEAEQTPVNNQTQSNKKEPNGEGIPKMSFNAKNGGSDFLSIVNAVSKNKEDTVREEEQIPENNQGLPSEKGPNGKKKEVNAKGNEFEEEKEEEVTHEILNLDEASSEKETGLCKYLNDEQKGYLDTTLEECPDDELMYNFKAKFSTPLNEEVIKSLKLKKLRSSVNSESVHRKKIKRTRTMAEF